MRIFFILAHCGKTGHSENFWVDGQFMKYEKKRHIRQIRGKQDMHEIRGHWEIHEIQEKTTGHSKTLGETEKS